MKTEVGGYKVREQRIEAVGIKIKQSPVECDLYIFAIDGKTITKQVGVRRMKWHGTKFKAEGFQRRLDNIRVTEIATYLSHNPVLPNALVIAFERGALSFDPLPNQEKDKPQWGKIVIGGKLRETDGKLEALPEEERIGYVIDGQHRLRGIECSTLAEGTFPVVVCAFHGISSRFQLEQFYALNQTVKISSTQLALLRRELGYELPPKEAYKKAISRVCERLQEFQGSPFQPEKHVGTAIYKGPLSITVVESMIERAIKTTSLKFRWKQNANEIPDTDLEFIAKSLYIFWKGISEVFAQYWGRKPKDQRLFCAIGLYAMILFFDKVMEKIDINSPKAVDEVKARLKPIEDIPWDKMLGVPATVKTHFRPEHLFDAVNGLWGENGKRPCMFRIPNPLEPKEALVDLELTGS
jgi:DGQHR domain-containing protein